MLGLVRDQVLAALFGAGIAMDAYNVAFRIPNLLRDLFAEGAMSAAFVPTFTRHLTTSGKDSAWRLANNVINALAVITGVLVVLGVVFAEPLVRLIDRRRFTTNPGEAGAHRAAGAGDAADADVHRAGRRADGDAELAPSLLHPGALPGDVQRGDHPVRVRGRAVHAGVRHRSDCRDCGQHAARRRRAAGLQWPALRSEGFRYRPILDWTDEGLRRVLVLMGPGTVGLAATQVNVLVNMALATSQETGAVTWLNYAFRLMYLPIGLFGVSIATATLPAVSRHPQHAIRLPSAATVSTACR